MNANQKNELLRARLSRAGMEVSDATAETLRRAAQTLRRWYEAECGDSGPYASSSIERDDETGKPFRCVYPHTGEPQRYAIPDREAGAIRRIAEVCKREGLHYRTQGDPRGAVLYVWHSEMSDFSSDGISCEV